MDIEGHTWADHESVGSPTEHVAALELYRDSVVGPSLKVLDGKIQQLERSDDPADEFLLDEYVPMFQATVEGYLLAVQSMWERGLRAMLSERAAKQVGGGEAKVAALRKALWKDEQRNDLHDYFFDLMGLPLQAFDSFGDLDVLQLFGNALRHGDGRSAEQLHQRCPALWFNWLAPGTVVGFGPFRIEVPADAPAHPLLKDITLPEKVLEQMIQSVIWFWQDVEYIRCGSFRRKDPQVEEQLARHREDRARRASARVWTPG